MKLNSKIFLSILGQVTFCSGLFAQAKSQPIGWWESIEMADKALILIAIALLFPIYFLSKIFKFSLIHYLQTRIAKNKLKSIALILFLAPFAAKAQGEVPLSEFFLNFNFLRWILILVILIEVFALFLMTHIIQSQYKSTSNNDKVEKERKSFSIGKWWKKANNFGTEEDNAKIDSGHNYDGIRELDNDIPVWFTAAFVSCVVFAVFYLWFYHFAELSPLQEEEYNQSLSEAEIERQKYLKIAGSGIDENTLVLSTEASDLAEGKKMFLANCASCHATDGGGGTGPNLTDNSWIYSCTDKDIFQSVKYGRANGMMPWKNVYNDKQIVQIASFVKSLQGSKSLSPKAAQGKVCDMNAAAAAVDSASTSTLVDSASVKL